MTYLPVTADSKRASSLCSLPQLLLNLVHCNLKNNLSYLLFIYILFTHATRGIKRCIGGS